MILKDMDVFERKFGKVALLVGGRSAERDISIKSGQTVYKALKDAGVDVDVIDVNGHIYEVLSKNHYDCAFNILHGRDGEDGIIQSVLELLEIPYTGTGVLGSAISMDKVKAKQIWSAVGLSTPDFIFLDNEYDLEKVQSVLGFPVIIKPTHEGSSIGISKVEKKADLNVAWLEAKKYGRVIAEKWVNGGEYTAPILRGENLPIIKIETPRIFYDYQAKYFDDQTQYHCPSGLDSEIEHKCYEAALKAFNAIGGFGWGRVDFILDENTDEIWLIDINTVPGMTDHSLVPMSAKNIGIELPELVLLILSTIDGDKNGC